MYRFNVVQYPNGSILGCARSFYKGFRVIHEVGDDKVEIVTIRHMREDLTGSGTEDSS